MEKYISYKCKYICFYYNKITIHPVKSISTNTWRADSEPPWIHSQIKQKFPKKLAKLINHVWNPSNNGKKSDQNKRKRGAFLLILSFRWGKVKALVVGFQLLIIHIPNASHASTPTAIAGKRLLRRLQRRLRLLSFGLLLFLHFDFLDVVTHRWGGERPM